MESFDYILKYFVTPFVVLFVIGLIICVSIYGYKQPKYDVTCFDNFATIYEASNVTNLHTNGGSVSFRISDGYTNIKLTNLKCVVIQQT